jgi:two-component system chemotaxis sensor kinase CheA
MDMTEETLGILVQEAHELLASMEAALLAIENGDDSSERINEIFRAAHTIKGSSGLFGLDLIVSFTHLMESVLVRVRNDELCIDPLLTSLLLSCSDYVGSMVDSLSCKDELLDPDSAARQHLSAELQTYLEPVQQAQAAPVVEQASQRVEAKWHIALKLSPQLLLLGLDPLPFINYLGGKGQITRIETILTALPVLQDIDPEQCYLGFDIEFLSHANQAEIEEVFEFIREESEIKVTLCQPLAEEPAISAKSAEAFERRDQPDRRKTQEQVFLKVEAKKLDQLIDAVGELVIRSASGRTLAGTASQTAISEFMEEVEQFVEQIRDRALNLRMTPIGEVFQRFPRVIRDVSKELGKHIELTINGADTELDKSMIDKLGDPLMHIIRNAMDHGIESVAQRIAAGKSEQGSLKLNAYHESGCIVIEVSDDGKGLDKAKILRKAIERKLVDASHPLSEQEVFLLIFEPGFSTADQVTDLSGRGVGMDVVRRNIEQLHGQVEIESSEGVGTTLRIRLPLTLSIIEGFQIAVGTSNFVIPLETVVECIELTTPVDSKRIINLRGVPLPYIRLADEFAIESMPNSRQCLVVLQYGQQRAGIVVDRFVGELQAVIKPLSHVLRSLKGLGGSTILGDGSVALILDVASLLNRSRKIQEALENVATVQQIN